MEKTNLIQRLRKPLGFANPFAFGASGPNGGLSDKALEKTLAAWSFDYMGAAQFEHGAVPEALSRIEQYAQEGRAFADCMPVRKIHEVFYLCEQSTEREVERRIWQLYRNERSLRVREYCGLRESLNHPERAEVVGWLELDNGYLFFTDETMFIRTLELFGVQGLD